jgi:hypothetical protein
VIETISQHAQRACLDGGKRGLLRLAEPAGWWGTPHITSRLEVAAPAQAKVLTNVLADALCLHQRYFDEMSALRGEVRELAQSQNRTEQRVERLAEAQ